MKACSLFVPPVTDSVDEVDDATSDDTVMKLPADTPIFDEQGRFNLQLWRKCNIGQRDKTSENPIRTAEEIL